MSRLLLPFALTISHFLLINHSTAARSVDGLAYNTAALHTIKPISGNLSDSSPVRYTTVTGPYTVQVIIPTKTVCRQRVNTFFIVTMPDTLLNQPTTQPEEPVTSNKTTGTTNTIVNGLNIGGGSDELELLLKTPGRLTNNLSLNSLTGTAAVTACLSLLQITPFFCW